MKKTAFMMLVFLLLFSLTTHIRADTIIDTTYSIPEMDGWIGYNTQWETYYVSTIGGLHVGDWWDWYNGGNSFARSFVSFPIPEIPEGYELDSSYIYLYQFDSFGNSLEGLFPIWDMPWGSYEYPCYLDHVDYGLYLDEEDFDSGVLENHIGDISETYEVGWRTLEITQYVQDDIQAEREYSQYRLRFPINTDFDDLDDNLSFASGAAGSHSPYIRFVFTDGEGIENKVSSEKNRISIYPNPFRISTSIKFSAPTRNTEIVIFNIKGEIVKKLELGRENRIQWNGKDENGNVVGNGLYLIKIENDEINVAKKAIKLN